ncbi:hypothetical protein [Pseudomonas oryzihabitans]|uniref:hypothetical protein n=1 Tax=Pseudomonas oryzihabitans TaxID=47885 RepID=UPI00214E88DE|nr:hypothetical protein [Pseudomonas psychrotolerans]UUW70546.1 hypothetical protein NRG74_15770 [Pseudomonas psychrotolerans]
MALLSQAKGLARRYKELTGKPLGITGEVAEYEAARLLGLELHSARQAGYDATEIRDGSPRRIQIKGRQVTSGNRRAGRMGAIDLRQEFDSVLLVLLDDDFNAYEMREASRGDVEAALARPGSKARNERGSLAIAQFKAISILRWRR